MALLVDVARDAEDPAYAEMAALRGGRRRPVTAGGLVVVLLVGLALGGAAAALRAGRDDRVAVRASLLEEVRERTAEVEGLERESARLGQEVAAEQDRVLARDARGQAQAARLAEVELAAGTVAVTGPGVVVTLDDRPEDTATGGLGRGGAVGDGRVQDRDLQELVNALWAAGAEAVAVNGQRLTARTAIRSAGEAVLVDFRPLSPPYDVTAVGEPGALARALTADGPGARIVDYAALYGLPLEVRRQDEVRLPAGSDEPLATTVPEGS